MIDLRRRGMAALLLAAPALLAGCSREPCGRLFGAPEYDLLVRGGRIVDGTGGPARAGDVLVCGDLVARVGPAGAARARDTIDASGLVVAPGFVDMLGQSEYALFLNGDALSKVTQGITSEVTGEVTSVVPVNGNTLATLTPLQRKLTTWDDLDGYFDALERSGTAINLGTYVTLGSVRTAVLGSAGRAPTPAEMERMEAMVDRAMEQGALGLSTGLGYPPASSATTAEIVGLARVAAAHGGGYASHIRSEGDSLVESVREAIRVGERAGTSVHIHHLKAAGHRNWGKMKEAIAAIEEARARGVDVTADQYPYAASFTSLDVALPGWVVAPGKAGLPAALRDPATRERVRGELHARWADWRGGARHTGPGSVTIAGVGTDTLRRYVGLGLPEVARRRGQEVEDAMIDLVIGDSAQTSAVFFSMSEAEVEEAMRMPWVGFGTDAGATSPRPGRTTRLHPRAFGSFPRVLCRYVRERGTLTVEEAVRRFTSLPAARAGLHRRGVLRAGMYADLAVFDPGQVCDRATFEAPDQLSTGVRYVVVNGTPVLWDGRSTGARPGRSLRRGE